MPERIVINTGPLIALDFPYLEAAGYSFKAILKTRRDRPFARFIRDCSGSLQLTLTDLVVLRVLRSRIEAPIELLASKAQRPIEYLEDALRDLEKRNLVSRDRRPRLYRLSEATTDRLDMYDEEGQLRLF